MDVDVTSHGTTYKGLSPFFLGPYTAPDGRIAQNMENLWQYSKVYPEHIGLYENVTKKWIEWSNAGFESRKAERYPMGKGAVPKFSVWGYKRLSYIEARKHIYIPAYATLVLQSKLWREFKESANQAEHVIIRDFDVYNHHVLNMGWEDVVNDPDRKCGHGFILAMLLEYEEYLLNIVENWKK